MRHIRSILSLAIVVLSIAAVIAATPRDGLVVSPAWLAQHLNDPDLVLLQVGEKGDYDAKHLPNARYVALQDLAVSDHSGQGLMLEMLPPAVLRDRLAALGISDTSRIVVYWSKGWVSPATRVIFTLDYAGLGDRTMLLDGGIENWIRAGQKVTDAVTPQRSGTLSPLKIHPLVVDAEYVRAHLNDPNVSIVDARSTSMYDGVQSGNSHGTPHKTGHIAGAKSVPYSSIVNDADMMRPAEELRAIFTKAGVKPSDTVVTYCHIGQQATATLFAARTLGHPVLLYDGSFEDWSRRDYPVENPPKKDR